MLDPKYVKACITLSDVVGQYVKLKRSGSSKTKWVGLCPFHKERTPSFAVSDEDGGFFKCFGCGEGGDLLSFIQKIEGVDFKEALRQCKLIAGIKDEYLSPEQRRVYEAEARRKAAEAEAFRRWKRGLVDSLVCYTNAIWRMHRNAKRSGEEGDEFYSEAIGKESALDQLESMPDKDLLEYYRTRNSWAGAMNPVWYLSGTRLVIAENEKAR